jgi:hypothetical protein
MARRRQEVDVVGLVAQLTGLVVLISLFFPAVRRALAELGFIAVCFSILVVAGLIGFGIYRLATREDRMRNHPGPSRTGVAAPIPLAALNRKDRL